MIRKTGVSAVIAAAMIAGFGTQAVALSCMQSTAENLYNTAKSAVQIYRPVLGSFQFDENLAKQDPGNTPTEREFQATFVGKTLTQAGFTLDFTTPVTVKLTCSGPWCGSLKPNWPFMAMLEARGPNHTFTVNACNGYALSAPDNRDVDRFMTCVRQGCKRSNSR